jgi:uncharacterized protein YbjT (DUF2867 family)
MTSLVLGATGILGGLIARRLAERNHPTFALSRRPQRQLSNIEWLRGDLAAPTALRLPSVDIVYATVHPQLLARALVHIPPPKRLVCFTSSSILTKIESEIETERNAVLQLAKGEQNLQTVCDELSIPWTILRPTLIYAEGRDANVTRIADFARRFKFFPLAGAGRGLRQPVHAEDLAIGALSVAKTERTLNKTYVLAGGETLTYREMVGRIFDGLGQPRRLVAVPPVIWKNTFQLVQRLFPRANYAMGLRMSLDMTFDQSDAVDDFGWNPRKFHPEFGRHFVGRAR